MTIGGFDLCLSFLFSILDYSLHCVSWFGRFLCWACEGPIQFGSRFTKGTGFDLVYKYGVLAMCIMYP